MLQSGPTKKPALPDVAAEAGLVVEDVETGWVGAIVRVEKIGGMRLVVLEDRDGRTKSFPLGPGFWVDGQPINLVAPTGGAASRPGAGGSSRGAGAGDSGATGSSRAGAAAGGAAGQRPTGTSGGNTSTSSTLRSASGSRAVVGAQARVARRSRIWVEGTHDAELVERIWGHDLRIEGVVVEPLGGIDHLVDKVARFAPSPGRRLGVLVDHLVAGTKETRIVQETLAKAPGGEHVMIVGHPFIDIWQAIKPARVGLTQWPDIPREIDFKAGTLRALSLPSDTQADKAAGWQHILSTVRHYGDLEPALLGCVEQLIDHVTEDPEDT